MLLLWENSGIPSMQFQGLHIPFIGTIQIAVPAHTVVMSPFPPIMQMGQLRILPRSIPDIIHRKLLPLQNRD
jgi:hypothetical protein